MHGREERSPGRDTRPGRGSVLSRLSKPLFRGATLRAGTGPQKGWRKTCAAEARGRLSPYEALLCSLPAYSEVATRVGPTGWSYRDWNRIVYPHSKPRGFNALAYIAQYFDTVEINSSFYGSPRPSAVKKWVESVGANPHFRCCGKFGRLEPFVAPLSICRRKGRGAGATT